MPSFFLSPHSYNGSTEGKKRRSHRLPRPTFRNPFSRKKWQYKLNGIDLQWTRKWLTFGSPLRFINNTMPYLFYCAVAEYCWKTRSGWGSERVKRIHMVTMSRLYFLGLRRRSRRLDRASEAGSNRVNAPTGRGSAAAKLIRSKTRGMFSKITALVAEVVGVGGQ